MTHQLLCIATLAAAGSALAQTSIPVNGYWRFALDPENQGVQKGFPERDLPGRIHLPGTTDQAKAGPGNSAKPTLDGLYRLYPYEGAAWYQKDIEIPQQWSGKRVSLFLERVHWTTRVWFDGKFAGTQDSLIAPHVFDFGAGLTPGKHRITLCVDNTKKIDLGRFVSILYEGTQTNWNGVIGALELRAADQVSIEDVQVYPDVDRKLAKIRIVITNMTGKPANGKLTLSADGPPKTVPFQAAGPKTTVDVEFPMGNDVKLWDEFAPALNKLNVAMSANGYASERSVTFGMRKFAAKGTQFTLNGRPLYLRGTLECAIFPRTGYPPTDVPSWQRIYRIAKSYGLNYMRFHSWCPPEAAFAAADIEGVIVQAEGPQANIKAGENAARDAFIESEFFRIVRTYGNHPSFCLMTLGNEYGGPDAVLSRWVGELIKEDPRHLYSSASSAQKTENRQFTVSGPRGTHGPGTDFDFHEALAKETRPLLGHEIGQWTFFPNFDEIPKYTGVLAAKNFELVRADLEAKHLLPLAPQFVQATGKHAMLLYKEEIEVLMRTPGHAGFALLDLHDYPGQGTALIGPLDPFWDSKGFVKPEIHTRYCGPTVPLLRMKKRTFTADETFTATAEIAHFGARDLAGAQPYWSIRDERGREVAAGAFASTNIPTGKLTALGEIGASLRRANAPCKLTVSVSLKNTGFTNEWEIWVYPASVNTAAPAGVVVSRLWDDAAKAALANGARVVLFPSSANSAQSLSGRFLPVFWSPVWFPKQKPNTMGILCDPKHPALAQFPTEFYSNWQWHDLIQSSRSLILDDAPEEFQPIVQVIDNFARNHRLGNLLEARYGKGRLLICAIDLPELAGKQPAARQLLASLYAYAASDKFNPGQELSAQFLDRLFAPEAPSAMQKLGARIVRADSEQGQYEAANILDGDPATIWHTSWEDHAPGFPHEIVIGLRQPAPMSGIRVLPRQDMRNGWIKDYEIALSADGKQWRTAARGTFERNGEEKLIKFSGAQTAQYVKFIAVSGFDPGKPYASLAEFSIVN